MTVLNIADIPSSINSVEKLAVWSLTVLNDLYATQTIEEAVNSTEFVTQSAPFYVQASTPPGWRLISRLSVPLAPGWRRQGKIWVHAQDIG
ncbi:MAG TPA: hypothetical protein V6D18_20250, partial [Thermosynechococcaceae cyanobacterium]